MQIAGRRNTQPLKIAMKSKDLLVKRDAKSITYGHTQLCDLPPDQDPELSLSKGNASRGCAQVVDGGVGTSRSQVKSVSQTVSDESAMYRSSAMSGVSCDGGRYRSHGNHVCDECQVSAANTHVDSSVCSVEKSCFYNKHGVESTRKCNGEVSDSSSQNNERLVRIEKGCDADFIKQGDTVTGDSSSEKTLNMSSSIAGMKSNEHLSGNGSSGEVGDNSVNANCCLPSETMSNSRSEEKESAGNDVTFESAEDEEGNVLGKEYWEDDADDDDEEAPEFDFCIYCPEHKGGFKDVYCPIHNAGPGGPTLEGEDGSSHVHLAAGKPSGTSPLMSSQPKPGQQSESVDVHKEVVIGKRDLKRKLPEKWVDTCILPVMTDDEVVYDRKDLDLLYRKKYFICLKDRMRSPSYNLALDGIVRNTEEHRRLKRSILKAEEQEDMLEWKKESKMQKGEERLQRMLDKVELEKRWCEVNKKNEELWREERKSNEKKWRKSQMQSERRYQKLEAEKRGIEQQISKVIWKLIMAGFVSLP
jgi:hypothetical protein